MDLEEGFQDLGDGVARLRRQLVKAGEEALQPGVRGRLRSASHELVGGGAERVRDGLQGGEARLTDSELVLADRGGLEAGALAEPVLGPALHLAEAADARSERRRRRVPLSSPHGAGNHRRSRRASGAQSPIFYEVFRNGP